MTFERKLLYVVKPIVSAKTILYRKMKIN